MERDGHEAGLAAPEIRLATEADLPGLAVLMAASITVLQQGFLTPEEIAASCMIMGLDTQLIADRTYFAAIAGERPVGSGGWSRRATLYGGDHTTDARDARLLDPATEPARVRAMYTHPDFARRGLARAILGRCEAAAAAAGFAQVELMSTLAGEPLYLEAGYRPIEQSGAQVGAVFVPLIRMGKNFW